MTLKTLAAAGAAAALGLALAFTGAKAQSYPTRTITLVVPFAAGGPSDVIARLIGQSMSQALGQQVIVENVAGAGGTAGAARVAKAAPDGYTLLIHHLALTAAPSLYNNLPYDTKKAFVPIGLVNTGPMVLTGKKDLPPKDAKELFAYIKKEGDKVTMAHAGVGSNAHLCAVLLSQELKAKVTMVPYGGTGPAMNDLMGGQVDVLCDQSTTAVPQVTAGTVKGYVTTGQKRLDVIKDVPTSTEAGLASFDMTVWHGLYAPAGTPDEVVKKLNEALDKALGEKAVNERFAAVGTTAFPQVEWTPAAHQKRFLAEIDRWASLLKNAGVTPGQAK